MPPTVENKLYIVSRELLADLLLITPHEVNSLWKNHGMPKESRGQYDLLKVVPFIVRRKNAQIQVAKHGDVSKAEADRQTSIFNMELLRIELAEKQRVTLNANDVERALIPAFIATAKKLETLIREIQTTFPKDERPEIRSAREEKMNKISDDIRSTMADIPLKLFGEKPRKPSKKKSPRKKKK